MEYEIYGIVLVALGIILSLFFTIGKPILKLNSTLTEIITKMDIMEGQVNGFTEKNRESHKRIHERIDDVESDVGKLKETIHLYKK